MKNFKINKNQQPLSESDLAQGKDFSKVIQSYKAMKTPYFKAPKFWFGASSVLVATVAAVLVLSKMNAPDVVPVAPDAFIHPPVTTADIPNSTYILNAQSDSTITHPGGTLIHVPANAFIDKDGKIAQGKVELHYREFKNPLDVFLAGIPMTYDSGGQVYHFETAGMMEIRATQNGLTLKTNPDAPIKVDLVSDNNEDRFNTYHLDTQAKKWKYLAQSNYNPQLNTLLVDSAGVQPLHFEVPPMGANKVLSKDSQAVRATENEIATLQQQKPIAPVKAQKDKARFSIKVDEREFPEIAVYKNVKFQVADDQYKPEKADVTWSDISLERIEGSPKYKITFINPNEKYQIVAIPVFGDKDYAAANSTYNQKYSEYEAALTKKKAEEARLKAEIQATIKAQEEALAKMYKEREQQQKDYQARMLQANIIYRSFTVSDFGYYNSDHPCSLPAGSSIVNLILVDATTKKPIDAQTCYLVEKERKALFYFSSNGFNRFRYNRDKHNGLWVIMNDQKIAVAKYSKFEQAKRNGNNLEVEVTLMDKTLKNPDEVRKYLEM